MKTFIVTTDIEYSVIVMADTAKEAIAKASIHYYTQCYENLELCSPSAKQMEPYEIFEVK